MSKLAAFARHAREMATATHRPECPTWQAECPGCVSDADRELWARLAAEASAHLGRHGGDDLDLFGEVSE